MTQIMNAPEMTDGQIENAVNKLRDAMRKHRSKITSDVAQQVLGVENLGMMMFKPFCLQAEAISNTIAGCVKRISVEPLVLEPEDGTATIAKARKTFGWIDADFKNYGTDVKGKSTPRQNVEVHEIVKDGNFKAIFTGISEDLDSLCLSQAQIIQFCEKHRSWLRTEGDATFFLFKVGDEFLVARVHPYGGACYVDACRFSNVRVWAARYHRRVVVPQRVPSDT